MPAKTLLIGAISGLGANTGPMSWVQHTAQSLESYFDQYILRDGTKWGREWSALANLADVKSSAAMAGDENLWAIAEIMTCFGFLRLTDLFDAIPYSDALLLREGVSFNTYDPQSEIYPDLIDRLEAAAASIDPLASVDFSEYDPVYNGDMVGWRRFANSLRLRLAMRMVNVDPVAARSAFEAAWSSEVFTGTADQAELPRWPGTQIRADPTTFSLRTSESLIDRLKAFNDPRLPMYADTTGDGSYRGLRNGLRPGEYDPPRLRPDFSPIDAYFLFSSPYVLMSYAEVMFLGAEAEALGWDAGGTGAEQLYRDGITAAMERLGVGSTEIAAYLAQPEVGYTTGLYRGLDAIHVQKWIALYYEGLEAFADIRRIGWDFTTDPGTTGSDLVPAEGSSLPPGQFPARLPYPEEEALVNPENYPGDAQITDPVWWMN